MNLGIGRLGVRRNVGLSGVPFWGLTFDGGDYLTATDAACGTELDFGTDDFSIAVWVKSSASSGIHGIISKYGGGGFGGWTAFLRYTTNNGGALRLWDGASATDIEPDADQTATIYDGNWHSIVWTADRDGNGLMYLDGSLVGTTDISSISAVSVTTSENGRIGAYADDNTFLFDGSMSALTVWKGTALTGPQAAAWHALTSPYSAIAVANTSQWVFNPGNGTSVTPDTGAITWTFGAGAAAPSWEGPYRRIGTGGPQ